jgi:hypothetical protein
MGWRDRRARREIKDPVRGEFRVSGQYVTHPGSTPLRETLTGVVTGPGIPPTAGEHPDDRRGRRIGRDVLPALVDRTDPTRFVILWDEIPVPDFRADAREQARQAAAGMQPGAASAPATPAPQVYVYGDPDGAPVPDWARQTVEDLLTGRTAGPTVTPPGAGPVAGPPLVLDLTAGHLSAADADRLTATGEPATAVLTAVSEVAVPAAALARTDRVPVRPHAPGQPRRRAGLHRVRQARVPGCPPARHHRRRRCGPAGTGRPRRPRPGRHRRRRLRRGPLTPPSRGRLVARAAGSCNRGPART